MIQHKIFRHASDIDFSGIEAQLTRMKNRVSVEERRQQIFESIAASGTARLSLLAQAFAVSEMTIRRDLEELENRQLVLRTHGGAALREGTAKDQDVARRRGEHQAEKTAIAKAAVQLIAPGDVIALDASTSSLELSRWLRGIPNLTVVTNNLLIPTILASNSNVQVICVGGHLRPSALSTVGPLACRTIDEFNYNKVFISTNAVDPVRGLSDTDVHEIECKRRMLQNASTIVLLADSSKLGKQSFHRWWPANGVHVLVTDSGAPPEILRAFRSQGVTVMLNS